MGITDADNNIIMVTVKLLGDDLILRSSLCYSKFIKTDQWHFCNIYIAVLHEGHSASQAPKPYHFISPRGGGGYDKFKCSLVPFWTNRLIKIVFSFWADMNLLMLMVI